MRPLTAEPLLGSSSLFFFFFSEQFAQLCPISPDLPQICPVLPNFA